MLLRCPKPLCCYAGRSQRRYTTRGRPIGGSSTVLDSSSRMQLVNSLVDIVGKKLGISQLQQWYQVKATQFSRAAASKALRVHFGGSLFKLLKEAYPNHTWQAWKFKRIETGFWKVKQNHRIFFDSVGESHGISDATLGKWYELDADTVERAGGTSTLLSKPSLGIGAVVLTFPPRS